MDGRSCGLGRVLAVTSDGTSSGDTKIPLRKHCAPDGTSPQAENADGSLEAGMCVDFSKSMGLGVKKGLQKCATFPPSTGEAQQEDSDDTPNDAPTYERSVSLPSTLKLVSAMKGSCQKNGMASKTENRHVKWAPDVYDPPVTSVCHSVNYSYQRRSKSRKKDKNKQKQKHKGRSKKKQHNASQNSAVLQAPGLKDVGTSSGGSAPDDLGKQETEILDYGNSSQEDKCGSSFLRETVAKMHFSTAEAS